MYLKLTNDDTASFYNNESMNVESEEICFKFNPYHYPRDLISFCFELDVTDNLLSYLKWKGVEMHADVSKLQFYLKQNGEIGPCS